MQGALVVRYDPYINNCTQDNICVFLFSKENLLLIDLQKGNVKVIQKHVKTVLRVSLVFNIYTFSQRTVVIIKFRKKENHSMVLSKICFIWNVGNVLQEFLQRLTVWFGIMAHLLLLVI